MRPEIWVTAIASALVSFLGTAAARRIALRHGVIDVPNQRSSHAIPTPRGGGIGIVLASTAAFLVLGLLRELRPHVLIALVGGGTLVALVGYLDDRRGVSVRVRLAVHMAAATWAMLWLGGLPPLHLGQHTYELGSAGFVLGVMAIVWVLNLFNFMDGIDGLAATEAVFVAWAGGGLAAVAGICGVGAAAFAFGAACLGFALWNWPPAKIFMGDVGSGYLGFVIAVLALAAGRESSAALPTWLILGAAFFVDATLTLLRRLLRGQPVHSPHRSHAYQRLARRWGAHRQVTITFIALDLALLLPCALTATVHPAFAPDILVVTITLLTALAWVAGAGQPDAP